MNNHRAEQLRAAGLRVTAPRLATLDWLAEHPHATAEQVADGVRARFETRTDDHHHLVCRGCGRTEDVDHVVGAAPCVEPTTSAGFVIDEAEVVFWGYCPACRSSRHTAPRFE